MKVSRMMALVIMESKDILKNLQVLCLFLVYPCIAFILSISMKEEVSFFITVFATMHVVFTPITVMVNLLSEQKQHQIVRNLAYANVSSSTYLLAHGLLIGTLCFVSGLVFLFLPGFELAIPSFLLSCLLGILISILLGALIALSSTSSSEANGIAMPIAMLLSFVPMLANFNETLRTVSEILYSAQISNMMKDLSSISLWDMMVLILTTLILVWLFIRAYHKSMKSE